MKPAVVNKPVKSTPSKNLSATDSAIQSQKKLLYIFGGVVAFYLLFQIATTASEKIQSVLDGDPNIDDLVPNTGGGFDIKNTTITKSQAANFAQQLLEAMNVKQPIYGTDEETIEKIFNKIKTKDDFLLVYDAFGMKDYNGNNSPPTGIWSNIDSYKKQNLVYWLKSELSNGFFASAAEKRAYKKVKEIVEKAGFVF